MKKLIRTKPKFALLLIAFVCSTLLSAQPQGRSQGERQGPPPIPDTEQIEKMVDELSEVLGLTKDEIDKIELLYKAHFNEVEGKIKESRPARDEMDALKTKFEKQVLALLSEDQQKKFKEFQKNKRPRKRN